MKLCRNELVKALLAKPDTHKIMCLVADNYEDCIRIGNAQYVYSYDEDDEYPFSTWDINYSHVIPVDTFGIEITMTEEEIASI